jgi:hypothetical protein
MAVDPGNPASGIGCEADEGPLAGEPGWGSGHTPRVSAIERSSGAGAFARVLLSRLVAVTIAGWLLLASPALAKTPSGDFAGFSECPRFTAGVELCLIARITGGQVQIGKTSVPIDVPLLLQGGIIIEEPSFAETFVGALNGQTLSKAPLAVPGGLSGIVNPASLTGPLQRLFAQTVSSGNTAVTATTELVGLPLISTSKLETREGTALSLPVRIKLGNSFLSQQCFIGSAASPIRLELTTGVTAPPRPNAPIEGKLGKLAIKDEFEFIQVSGERLVDNSFAVPRATGCGGSYVTQIDALIDAKLALPSLAGNNTAVFQNEVQEGTSIGARASET